MAGGQNRILVVDDEKDIRNLLYEMLTDVGYRVEVVHDAVAARTAVRLNQFDLILLDIWMPGVDGVSLLKDWRSLGLDTPVVMLSGHGTIQTAVEATQLGAYDYLEKPARRERILLTVRNALLDRTKTSILPVAKPDSSSRYTLIGSSRRIQDLRTQIKDISATDSNVLIVGEPGTGKKLVARQIHDSRNHSGDAYVVVNMLGAAKFDFSASHFIENARDGTLVIPDIHASDAITQVKILGLLNQQTSESREEGGSSAPRWVVTAAPSIVKAVENGRFRADLYYRLSELVVHVPALREYAEDIPELVGFFTDLLSHKEVLPYKQVTTSALNSLRNHSWGGNIRELKSVLRQSLAIGSNDSITGADIDPLLVSIRSPDSPPAVEATSDWNAGFDLPLREAREQFEREYLLHNLKQCDSYVALSKKTGLHRTSLFRKLRDYGIEVTPGSEFATDSGGGETT